MDNVQYIYASLIERLKRVRNKIKKVALATGSLYFISICISVVLLTVAIESMFHLGKSGRWALDVGLLAIILVALIRYLGIPLYSLLFKPKYPSDDTLASQIGQHYSHIQDKFTNALQVFRKRTDNPEGYSMELVDVSLEDIEKTVAPLDFTKVVSVQPLKKLSRITMAIVLSFVLLWSVLSSHFSNAGYRLLHPMKEFEISPNLSLKISPGNVEVLKGENVNIQIEVDGGSINEVTLYLCKMEKNVQQEKILLPISAGRFSYTIQSIKDSTEYFVKAQSLLSPRYVISVIELPMVRNLQAKLTYPVYSRLESQFLDENVGDITSLKGTEVSIQIEANKILDQAKLVFQDGTEKPMRVVGREARGGFTLTKEGSYHISLADKKGNRNSDPIEYRLVVLEDQYPTVKITVPGMDVDMGEDMTLFLATEAEDDFGFSSMRLGYNILKGGIEGEPEYHYTELDIESYRQTEKFSLNYNWDLSNMGLIPEDVVIYFVEVFDNDLVSGPKSSRSLSYRVRFPSIYEIYTEVQKQHEEAFQSLESMYEDSKELKQKVDQLVQEMKRDPQLNWEERKELEEVLETQQRLREAVEELQQKLDQMIERMERNDLVSLETLKKYQELQQLLQEIATPEMIKAMEQLQKVMEKIDPKLLKQAVEKFNLTQEDFLNRIERTLSLLKRLYVEQKLDETVRKAEELLKQQKELMEQAQQASSKEESEKLAQDEKEIKEKSEELQKTLQELREKMAEFPNMPLSRMDAALDMMKREGLLQTMQMASDMFQVGNLSGARKQGQRAMDSLAELSELLKTAQKELQENQKKEVMEALKRSSHDLINLSKKQEELLQQGEGLDRNSARYGNLAEQQQDLASGLSRVAENIFELSQKTFFVTPELSRAIGRSMANMMESLRSLEERNGVRATRHQEGAMGALNEAVKQIRNSMNSLAGASSAMGFEEFMNRLAGMAAQQEGINQQTLELGVGGQLSLQQQAAMARLAAEQAALKKALEELQQEMGNRSEILGRLDEVGKEMGDVVKDLQNKNVSRRTIDRQKRILSRLLDAQKSVRRRDYSRKRQAEPGKDYFPVSPGQLPSDLGEKQVKLREDLLEALKEGYSRDYRELIKKYFEALAREQQREDLEK